jgi:coenzyme F420 hydrogenase subunit beta
LCLKVCPWYLNQESLDKTVFSKVRGKSEDEILLGIARRAYYGFTLNENIRWKSSSGGLVSTLLIHALRNKWIDGAILTRLNTCTLKAESFIARSETDILNSAGSKYIAVPTAVKMKEIMNDTGKFALVGLPCHIQGARMAGTLIPKLKNKISMYLGLMCSGTMNVFSIDFLLNVLGIQNELITDIQYRFKNGSEGWPGKFLVKLKNGMEKSISFDKYLTIIRAYVPLPCLLCCDQTNEFSDISFGDAWLPDITGNQAGMSIIVSRTENGEHLIQSACSNQSIQIKAISLADTIKSQLPLLKFKKSNKNLRFFFSQQLGTSPPEFSNMKFVENSSFTMKIRTTLLFFRFFLMSHNISRYLVEHLLALML